MRVGARGGGFYVQKTARLFEIPPLGRAGFVVLASAVASAALMFATARTLSPPVPSRSPEHVRRADAIGPVADRVIGGPIFLNPMRNGIPGHMPTPEDARRAL